MHKKKILLGSIASLSIVLAACSDDSKYDKLMKKADKAMEDLKVEKAIGYYKDILDLDFKDITYGSTRKEIVEELLDDAKDLKDEVSEITKDSEAALKSGKKIDFEKDSLEKITDTYSDIDNVISKIEDSHLKFPDYEELVKLQGTFDKNIEEKVLPRVFDEIDENIKAFNYEEVIAALDQLETLNSLNEKFKLQEKIDKLYTQVETDQERFIEMPREYTKREINIFKDENLGNITFLGEGTKNDDEGLYAYFKYDGDLSKIIRETGIDLRFIFSDGTSEETSYSDYSVYEDYGVLEFEVSEDSEAELSRIDYKFSFEEEEADYHTLTLESTKETATLPAILTVAEKSIKVDQTVEDTDRNITIKTIDISPDNIIVNATVEAKKDLEVEEFTAFITPSGSSNTNYDTEEYFKGIPTDVSAEIDVSQSLIENDPYVKVYAFGQVISINAKTGELESLPSEGLLFDYYHNEGSLDVVEGIDVGDEFYSSIDGKKYIDVVALTNGYGDNTSIKYKHLNKRFKTFTADIALAKTDSASSGTSVLSIIGDGKVLKKVTVSKKTESVNVPVSGVQVLEFKLEQTEGDEGYQTVLIGNGLLNH